MLFEELLSIIPFFTFQVLILYNGSLDDLFIMRFCQISICPWESKQESNMTLSCKQISIQFSLVSAYGDNSHQLTALNMGTFTNYCGCLLMRELTVLS